MEQIELGIKETEELVKAVGKVAVIIVGALKDGVQVSDAVILADAFIKNPSLIEELKAAVNGAALIDNELKDLKFAEGVVLAQLLYEEVKKIVAASKKVA